jgi:hypothetical protein
MPMLQRPLMQTIIYAAPRPETEEFMTILTRLEQWKENGVISPKQHALLSGLSPGEPCSLFLELNILLYAGMLAFVSGLGWTASTGRRSWATSSSGWPPYAQISPARRAIA